MSMSGTGLGGSAADQIDAKYRTALREGKKKYAPPRMVTKPRGGSGRGGFTGALRDREVLHEARRAGHADDRGPGSWCNLSKCG